MRIFITISSLLLLSTFNAFALPEQCVENATRMQPCEHLIYKMLISPTSQQSKQKKIYCVCLSDFKDIQKIPTTEQGRIRQKMMIKQYSAELEINEKTLLRLVRY